MSHCLTFVILDMHRNKNTFMDKFPEDVCKAESLIGGDPDIITREQFLPEQKKNYSQLFGSPSPKKSPKTPNNKGRKSASEILEFLLTSLTPLRITTYMYTPAKFSLVSVLFIVHIRNYYEYQHFL